MTDTLIAYDQTLDYQTKEVPVLIIAAAFVLALGGIAIAATIICGWKGAKQVVMDFLHGRATFICR